MSEVALILLAAVLANLLGLVWLALAMETHWEQVHGNTVLKPRTARRMRGLGAIAMGIALLLCFWADHPTMAVLVWFMALAGSALAVAFTLAWRPRLLAPLVAWAA